MEPDQDPLHGKLSDHRDETVELLKELVVFHRDGLGLCHLVPGGKGDRRTGLSSARVLSGPTWQLFVGSVNSRRE